MVKELVPQIFKKIEELKSNRNVYDGQNTLSGQESDQVLSHLQNSL